MDMPPEGTDFVMTLEALVKEHLLDTEEPDALFCRCCYTYVPRHPHHPGCLVGRLDAALDKLAATGVVCR